MNKRNDSKILKFPGNVAKLERQVEAILFAAEEPLDIKSIQDQLKARTDISKIRKFQNCKGRKLPTKLISAAFPVVFLLALYGSLVIWVL